MTTGQAGSSDALLVASLTRGDTAALAELYDRHGDAIYRAAFRRLGDRQLAEEVVQDTYLALWNRAELYDPSTGSLLAWLSTIARNRAIDRLRALGRRPAAMPLSAVGSSDDGDDRSLDLAVASGGLVGAGTPAMDPEQVVDESELRDEVRTALSAIPGDERQVLELAYYEELSQSEIAARLGWPLGTVKTRTRRALLRLRASLAGSLGPALALPRRSLDRADGSRGGDRWTTLRSSSASRGRSPRPGTCWRSSSMAPPMPSSCGSTSTAAQPARLNGEPGAWSRMVWRRPPLTARRPHQPLANASSPRSSHRASRAARTSC